MSLTKVFFATAKVSFTLALIIIAMMWLGGIEFMNDPNIFCSFIMSEIGGLWLIIAACLALASAHLRYHSEKMSYILGVAGAAICFVVGPFVVFAYVIGFLILRKLYSRKLYELLQKFCEEE